MKAVSVIHIMQEKCKLAEIHDWQGQAQIFFKDTLVSFTREDLKKIDAIMAEQEERWSTKPEPQPRDRE